MADRITDGNATAFPQSDLSPAVDPSGLTKRELFAAMAMQGMLSDESGGEIGGAFWKPLGCAIRSCEFADALIIALSRNGAEHA